MSKESEQITISRRALFKVGGGLAALAAGGIAANQLSKVDFEQIKEKLPGLGLAMGMIEEKYGGKKLEIPKGKEQMSFLEAELRMTKRKLAEFEVQMVWGGNMEGRTAEQYELTMRWLNAVSEYARDRVQRGECDEWSTDLYNGVQEYVAEHRAEWDPNNLSEIVLKQFEEERAELKKQMEENE